MILMLPICVFSQNQALENMRAAQKALRQLEQKADVTTVNSFLTDDFMTVHWNDTTNGKPDPARSPAPAPYSKPTELQNLEITLYRSAAAIAADAVFYGGDLSGKARTRTARWGKEGRR